jgi:uncharacterized protein YfaS (alpha-2-macroglobulin family)
MFATDNRHVSPGSQVSKIVPILLIATAFVMCAIIAGCTRNERRVDVKVDPLWSTVISAHTVGPIPRKGEIRIVFSQDVVAKASVGKEMEKLLSSDPKFKGRAAFENPRELVWKPSEELAGGRAYRIELHPAGLQGIPEKLTSYQFDVQVQAPEFEVHIDAPNTLSGSTALDIKTQTALSGEILTVDVEAADRVERILKGEFAGQPVVFKWQHADDGHSHRFVTLLARQTKSEKTILHWDGGPISAKNKGEREIDIPGKTEFLVTGVTASNDPSDRRIDVTFSDALARDQDLRGLVTLSRGTPRFRIEGNQLRVYVDHNAGETLDGDVQLTIAAGVRNDRGEQLKSASQHAVIFVSSKPQVRFVGSATILPEAEKITVPIEALNVRAIRVTAFRVYNDNLPQFLQVNNLDGQRELGRVGRNLWRKHIRLSAATDSKQLQKWQRYSLDVTDLMRKYPGSLIRLDIAFSRSDIAYDCPGLDSKAEALEPPPKDADTGDEAEASNWDYYQDEYDGERMDWSERENPCKRAFYVYGQNIKVGRNLLVSNIGLIAKRDQLGKLLLVATDLRNAQPLSGAQITAVNFQNQTIATVTTGNNGMVEFKPNTTPYLLIAEKGGQKGYLKVAQGLSLPVSHFDVGGEQVVSGLKGTLYGERGVWRPGDDIYLTLALQDQNKTIPANHPVKLELLDPRSQVVQTIINDKPVGGFYAFTLKTHEDAPTGDWTARATLGGTTFTKTLRIETVMPNRLKMDLKLDGQSQAAGSDAMLDASKPIRGSLSAQWLTGALAANLRADVSVRMSRGVTKFSRYADFTFDDPTRDYSNEPQSVFDGPLDTDGRARFDHSLQFEKKSPGMLNATFVTRVFEPSGAFSIQRQTQTLSPYERYIGIKLPKGDVARNMLLTDTTHTVEVASINVDGEPVSVKNIAITVYKIQWRWWWDQSGESLAQYQTATQIHNAIEGTTSTSAGAGKWNFAIKFPEWGRYLIRACDTVGGHCASQAFYIDWPSWAGRPQDQSGAGANVLAITSDKTDYKVGEVAKIELPEGVQGRALLTVENGSRILDAKWIDAGNEASSDKLKDKMASRRIEIPLTAAMSPNVYVNVTLIQPHTAKNNDRPLRMYGIVPIKVTDPKTHLQPMLDVPVEWAPESKAVIKVSESQGHAMNYTVAVVDEGLLGLTNYKTPNLHDFFYKREALGISTWDLFDQVAGAYSSDLERLLALGGSDQAGTNPDKNKSRFPPVVKFIGPFQLAAGKAATHEIVLPKYVGAVRVMVVAGLDSAYGSAEKSVFVRQPLMILPTLPRVVGPNEEVAVPVSVFTMDDSVRQVDVSIEGDNYFVVQGDGKTTLQFKASGEQLALLRLKTASRIGQGVVKFTAVSGKHRASAAINLSIRSPNAASIEYETKTLQPDESFTSSLKPHGLIGTNTAGLEVSSIPPLNLERRLAYLIQYPHGCLEQTTSGLFPQLFLPALVRLDASRKIEVENNVNAGIARLQLFQQGHGGFSYWPGNESGFAVGTNNFDPRASWSTNYVGHFLLEAERLGYHVPQSMRSGWLNYQRTAAQSWVPTAKLGSSHMLDQAYRLYTLALASQPDMGAMNRLREQPNLPITARWMVAAAYKLSGVNDAAQALIQSYKIENGNQISEYPYPDDTFGSRLRDQAIVLTAMVSMGARDQAQPLVRAISENLSSQSWYSTQSLAYSLMAMSKFVGADQAGSDSFIYNFEYGYAGKHKADRSDAPMYTATLGALPEAGASLTFKNTSKRVLFVSVISRGVSPPGESKATASGLSLDVEYADSQGKTVDVSKLASGTDLIARITVRNNEPFEVKNIALTQMLPAGWEIMNDRMDNVDTKGDRNAADERWKNDWYYAFYVKSRDKTEHLDIRDDRVQRYFSLQSGERVTFVTRLNAAYMGKFWLPGAQVEAMYDAARNAQTAGQWVQVVGRGEK